MSRLLTVFEAAHVLRLSPRSLGSKPFRDRHAIAGIKLGRRLLFDEAELERVIAAKREPTTTHAEPV